MKKIEKLEDIYLNGEIIEKNLSNTDLSSLDLSMVPKEAWNGVSFNGSNLSNTKIKFIPRNINGLINTILDGLDLTDIKEEEWADVLIYHTSFKDAKVNIDFQAINSKSIEGINLENVDLSYLNEIDLENVFIKGANFKNSKVNINPILIRGKVFDDTNLENVDLSKLNKDQFNNVSIRGANLKNTNIKLPNTVNIDENTLLDKEYASWFLDGDAPLDLKEKWYKKNMSWRDLITYKKYLSEKHLEYAYTKTQLDFIALVGLDYIEKNSENIDKIFSSDTLLEKAIIWYKKKGYIPSYIILDNYPLDNIDGFNLKTWHQIVKTYNYKKVLKKNDDEVNQIKSLLTMAAIFGVFNNDFNRNDGFPNVSMRLDKLLEYIKHVPEYLDPSKCKNIDIIFNNYHLAPVLLYIFNGNTIAEEYKDDLDNNHTLRKQIYRRIKNGFQHSLRHYVTDNYIEQEGKMLKLNPNVDEKSLALIKDIIIKELGGLEVLTSDKIISMFSSLKLEYNDDFYLFILDNYYNILASKEYQEILAQVQTKYKDIIKEYGHKANIADCRRYLEQVPYKNIRPGNEALAFMCKMCSLSQENFEAHQEIHEITKKRETSSIPYITNIVVGKENKIFGSMVRLDSPLNSLTGESKFGDSCQRLGKKGESCMRHAATSSNGRTFYIYNEKGETITQGWVWANGDVVCFDNFDDSSVFKKNIHAKLIIEIYKIAAKKIIEESDKAIREYSKNHPNDDAVKYQRIKRVTIGNAKKGINNAFDVSKYISIVADEIRKPEENVEYLKDSDEQIILAETGEQVQMPPANYHNVPLYRDPRIVKIDTGKTLSELDALKIKAIQINAQNTIMPILEDIKDGYDIARVMYCKPDNLRIIHGEDWYYIFDANEKYISVFDTARIKPRFNDEKSKALEEMWDGFYYILDESLNTDNKPKIISANFREDTSYLLYLYLLNQGVVEQVDEDYRYQIDSLDKERITKERQLEILKNISKIRKANIEATYIHEIYFKPSASYIMEKRKNDLTKLKAMI